MKASAYPNRNPIPARAGTGLRHPHYEAVLGGLPEVGWFEVHSENYFGTSVRAARRIITWSRSATTIP